MVKKFDVWLTQSREIYFGEIEAEDKESAIDEAMKRYEDKPEDYVMEDGDSSYEAEEV